LSGIVRAWNEQWAYPQLRLATNREFFAEAEERYGSELATYHGDWTDWWADGIGSGARPLGFNRRAQTELGTAQTLHSLAGALAGELASFPTAAVAHATEQLLLYVVEAGPFGSVGQVLDVVPTGDPPVGVAEERADPGDVGVVVGPRVPQPEPPKKEGPDVQRG